MKMSHRNLKKKERNEAPEELMGPAVLLGTQTTLLRCVLLSCLPTPSLSLYLLCSLLTEHRALMAFPTPKSTWPSYSCEISISVSQVQTFHEGNLIRPIFVFFPPDHRALVHLWLSCPSPEATLTQGDTVRQGSTTWDVCGFLGLSPPAEGQAS